MIKEKMARLASAFKEVCKAGQQKREAQYKISSLMSDKKYACINGIVVGMPDSSVFMGCCKSFKYDEICENNRCPAIARNMKYVAALENYRAARQAFLQELVFWKKTKTN